MALLGHQGNDISKKKDQRFWYSNNTAAGESSSGDVNTTELFMQHRIIAEWIRMDGE